MTLLVMIRVHLCLLCALASVSHSAAKSLGMPFPEYSYLDHPLFKFGIVKKPATVIMRKYVYHRGSGSVEVENARFTVGNANYNSYRSLKPFARGLDSLCLPPEVPLKDVDLQNFANITLNGPARAFLLIVPRHSMDLLGVKKVTGLDKSWKNLQAISSKSRLPIPAGSRDGPTVCWLPEAALVVEKPVAAGERLILPSQRALLVDSVRPVSAVHVLFATPGEPGSKPKPFPYPASPRFVRSRLSNKLEQVSAPRPNERCPTWLHDLYVTKNRMGGAYGEPNYWRTWHPAVDAVFWCGFGHEHGSFPGRYEPQFGYTAWKTPDGTRVHGRQEESNAGFKVMAIVLPETQQYVIMTMHLQCGKARRLGTRFHTGIFAVLDGEWRVEVELHMKVDFGAAVASDDKKGAVGLDERQNGIRRGLWASRRWLRKRRVNVLDLRDFPGSVDRRFKMRNDVAVTRRNEGTIRRGLYEQWEGGPNSCAGGRLSVDVRDVATAVREFREGVGGALQRLAGASVDREVRVLTEVRVGAGLCGFANEGARAFAGRVRAGGGTFYTDAYFGRVRAGAGFFAARQFVRAGFAGARLQRGEYLPADAWHGAYVRGAEGRRRVRLLNVEGAAGQLEN